MVIIGLSSGINFLAFNCESKTDALPDGQLLSPEELAYARRMVFPLRLLLGKPLAAGLTAARDALTKQLEDPELDDDVRRKRETDKSKLGVLLGLLA